MSCNKPKKCYEITGKKTKAGKQLYKFTEPTPPTKFTERKVACRRCAACRSKKSQEWAIRCFHESQMYDELSSFITLTYDPEHLPQGKTLVKEHPQKFIRALRDKLKPRKLRYLCAAEYGEQKDRPHYHFIIFGWMPEDKILEYTSNVGSYFQSELITKLWGKGSTQVCYATPATMNPASIQRSGSHTYAAVPPVMSGRRQISTLLEGGMLDRRPTGSSPDRNRRRCTGR